MLDTNIPEPRRYYTKLEGAIVNINSAIRMWFEDFDPLSIEVLARASYDVVHTLFKNKFGEQHGYQMLAKCVKPEAIKEAIDIFRKAYNFAKHADRDPNEDLTLNEDTPRYTICFTLLELFQITTERSKEQKTFLAYMLLEYPQIFQDSRKLRNINSLSGYTHINKCEFYKKAETNKGLRESIVRLPWNLDYWFDGSPSRPK